MVTHEQRSEMIINFINSHPLINVSMLCQLAGGADVANMHNALSGNRSISKTYIDAIEKVLKDYGFEGTDTK